VKKGGENVENRRQVRKGESEQSKGVKGDLRVNREEAGKPFLIPVNGMQSWVI